MLYPRLRSPLLFIVLIVFALASGPLSAERIFETGFEGDFKPVSGREDRPGQVITGEIDALLQEDSAWADVEVTYSRLTENPAEGEAAQRIKVDRVAANSRIQLSYRDFPLTPGQDLEIRFFGKSSDYTPISLRAVQKAPPYKTFWERSIPLVAEWQEIRSTVPGIYDVDNTQLLFVVSQPGTVDLDSLSIERTERAVMELSEYQRGNLLPNSSFPLGHTSPWIMQFYTEPWVSTDTGPTGAPALLAEVANNNHEHSMRIAFKAPANVPATVSIHARALQGSVSMALRMGPADGNLWTAPYQKLVPLNKTWQRATHTVELPVSNTGYYLLQIAFSGRGVVELDGVQIEVGEDSPEFKRSAAVELIAKEDKYQGLFLGDEDFSFTYTAYGDLEKVDHIVAELHDLYGNVHELGQPPVPGADFEERQINLTGSGQLPLGSYRLSLTAMDAEGQALSRTTEVLLHRARAPRFGDRFAYDSYFGTHYGTGHLTESGMQLVKKLGFNWVRLFRTFTWKEIEPQDDQFHFTEADRDLEILENNHLLPLAILGFGSPDWARRPGNATGWAAWAPRDLEDWSDFVSTVFERYGERVRYYEPWNEPYYASFFVGEANGPQKIIGSAEDYFDLHVRTYEAAPEGVKILWNTNSLETLERTEKLIELGILDYSDAITLHHYTSQTNPKEVLQEQIINMREAKSATHPDMPIWNSEGGLAGALFNLYNQVPPLQDNQHHLIWTDWYAKYFLYSIAAGLEKYFPYYMHPTSWWRNDYTFSNADGKLSPIILGMSNLAWQIDGLKYQESIQLDDLLKAYVFSDGKRSAAVLDGPHSARFVQRLEADTFPAYDLFGNDFRQNPSLNRYLLYLQAEMSGAQLASALKKAAKQ